MDLLQSAYQYYLENQDTFWEAMQRHLALSLSSLGIAIALCIPLGILISRRINIAEYIINVFNGFRVVPSLVILFLALPYLGLGFRPALVALTVLACPPVLINTYAGLRSVDRSVVEAARGVGMSAAQILWRIELPLALPAIIAGIRTAAVEVIASATLAAFIGGGGLGNFLTRGYALNDPKIMLVGAIPVALLAIVSELILSSVQRLSSTPTA
ncbi:MAG TPA: ABC transporter permease [Roseiflexaceae bacterium]|nr:ABC transporter permease [Roseiflexaceae bacterium]